jgi:hypothetical protein
MLPIRYRPWSRTDEPDSAERRWRRFSTEGFEAPHIFTEPKQACDLFS